MRLFRIYLALVLLVVGDAIYRRGQSMHAAYKAAYLGTPQPPRAPMTPSERFLLASIVGVGIAGIWVGIVWRAAQ